MLPKQFEKYFWDVDFEKLNEKKRRQYVISRILEYGDLEAIRWVLSNFRKRIIKEVVRKSMELTPKSANFWAVYFSISKDKILCLSKQLLQRRKTHWLR